MKTARPKNVENITEETDDTGNTTHLADELQVGDECPFCGAILQPATGGDSVKGSVECPDGCKLIW